MLWMIIKNTLPDYILDFLHYIFAQNIVEYDIKWQSHRHLFIQPTLIYSDTYFVAERVLGPWETMVNKKVLFCLQFSREI